MKSAAKCDTWCELQNPANHRVFERKLRPRPTGQGHVCLGVKHYVASCQLHPVDVWAGEGSDVQSGSSCPSVRRAEERVIISLAANDKGWIKARPMLLCRVCPREDYTYSGDPKSCVDQRMALGMRPQDGRGHPPSLSISISGGEETYEDSPSNGERTGIGPALESGRHAAARIVVWRSVLSDGPGPSPLERGAGEGESPVRPEPCRNTRRCRRVGLFGNAALIGR
ncbi:hypothetical protein M5K25_009023 [Dendrobium thyrsiflorum]|uniref:Uncharacterized protein n=1 Tax=Dendrobium thyrsiflorum TaxID=117978 RepID=A0ABD0VBH1_DENTH